jgi:hypothetical protein
MLDTCMDKVETKLIPALGKPSSICRDDVNHHQTPGKLRSEIRINHVGQGTVDDN